MDTPELRRLVDHYLPLLVTAGDYGRAIQPQVRGPQAKAGENAWAQAITDADLTIQNYFELATLALDPTLGFFGEESAQSANSRYFDAQAETVIHLDPVNATFLYQHQRDGWDIILNISHAGELRTVISYMPASGIFYLAVDGQAMTGDRQTPRLEKMRPLTLPPSDRVCLTYQAPEVIAALAGRFQAFDLVLDDDPERGLDNLNELFTGKVAAFACRGGDMLDWGALAYVVESAGGRASRLDGQPLKGLRNFDPQMQDDMLVAADPSVHAEILAALGVAV